MMDGYYKLLNRDGLTPQGFGKWPLPQGDKPGAWLPPIEGKLVPCENGYHVLKMKDLLEWTGQVLVEVEIKGRPIRAGNKSVVRQARAIRRLKAWNARTLRLFAADCAERVLPIWEEKHPGDLRPREAIQAARAFARGKISAKQLTAARDAAWAAEWDARRDAPRDAPGAAAWAVRGAARAARAPWAAAWAVRGAARAARAPRDAAWGAAWDVCAAAKDVTWAAAGNAERKWQNKRLQYYLKNK